MAQGLAMFDVNQRLIICNQRFLDLYNLPAVMAQPGTELTDILDHTARVEKLLPEQAKTLRQRRLATAASGEEATLQDFLSRSEEHTSELQSLMRISYAVFCLKKKNTNKNTQTK